MYVLRGVITVSVVALALAVLAIPRDRHHRFRHLALAVVTALVAFKAYDLVALAVASIRHPPLWDFSVFWMAGHIAATHHNVYDTLSYRPYAALLNPHHDVEYNAIALNIGLPYPPPAILLMYPLGAFRTVGAALLGWYVALFAALVASTVLLSRRYFGADRTAGFAVAALLVLALSATRMTVGLGQLNFFALLLLLLFWGERKAWRAGMWLAPLIVLRPLTALLAIYFFARREWNTLTACIATGAVFLAISIPVIGLPAFASYLQQNPTQRYPEKYFVGSQSLYKIIVTASHQYDGYFSLAAHPFFTIVSAVSIAAAALICAFRGARNRDACLALLVALALFLYPNTDTHYCVLLLVPLCALWSARQTLRVPSIVIGGTIVLTYLLLDVRDGRATTGLSLAIDAALFGSLAFVRQKTAARSSETVPNTNV